MIFDTNILPTSNYFYGFQLMYELTINSNIVCNPEPQNLNMNRNEPDVPIPEFLPKNLGLKK